MVLSYPVAPPMRSTHQYIAVIKLRPFPQLNYIYLLYKVVNIHISYYRIFLALNLRRDNCVSISFFMKSCKTKGGGGLG